MPWPTLPAEGGCRCGAVRFQVHMAPLLTMACHCRGCQRMTGSAFSLSAAVPEDGFEILQGSTVPGGVDKTFGHRFCPECLSWIWTKHPMMQGFLNVRSTMLDEPGWTRPFVETCTVEGLAFVTTGAVRSYPGLPSQEEYPALLAGYQEWAGA
jgi:hypothetical protein